MKKLLNIFLVAALVSVLALPVFAADLPAVFTEDSKAIPGNHMIVDKTAMLDHGSNTADTYNAMLEGNVIYCWYKNGKIHCSGTEATAASYEILQEDVGSQMYLVMEYYSDASYKTLVGTAESEKFTVMGADIPEITTKSLPDATVGEAYYVKLECTDGDAAFSEFMGSQLSEFGLTLTQHGEIEGTPTKSGNCHVNIAVKGEGGENSFSYDITVNKQEALTLAPTQATETTAATEEAPTEETVDETKKSSQKPSKNRKDEDDWEGEDEEVTEPDWWVIVVVAVVAAGAGAGVAVWLVKRKS